MNARMVFSALPLTILFIADSPGQGVLPPVYQVENTGADYPKPIFPPLGKLPTLEALPDPFAWSDGRGRISHYSDWRYRRAELASQIEYYEIGQKPVRPDSITANYSAGVLTVIVTVQGKRLTLTSQVVLPAGTGPFPAVIGMNSPGGSLPSTIFSTRNIAQITFSHDQVTTYNSPQNSDPYYVLYGPGLNIDNTGQYSAWAWGVSRIIDGLELVQSVLPVDLNHIAVTGCSYAGKMALFAGALDERIALTIAQESGGGGATSWRYSQTESPGTVETLGATSHQWFSESMFQFAGANVSKLPEDHHELCAMCAPRALYVTANPDYTWLSNPSCYVNSRAVQQIYSTLGIPERFGFSIVGGHLHCAVPGSEIPEIEAFVEKFLLGSDTVTTDVATTPYAIDMSPWMTWTTPQLTAGTSLITWTSLRSPADLQTGLDSTVTVRWSAVPGVRQYLVEVSSDSDFTGMVRTDSSAGDTVKSISGLLKGREYFWRVKAQSDAGVSLWSNVWRFMTAATPSKPKLLDAIPVQSQPGFATYTWNKVVDADQYLIRVTAVLTPNRVFRSGSTSDTVETFSGHTEGEQYSWQVQAGNIAGSGPWSDAADFNFSPTGVKNAGGTPAAFSIDQNFPNPFNPTTTITFALPKAALTTITLHDLLGRTVKTLLNRTLNAGYHEIQVDGTSLPSAVYFYTIQAGSFVQTKKMVVTK